jgi:TnpA family transposase
MPVQFLSEADHVRLSRFPAEISSEDLTAYFLLSQTDRLSFKHLRGDDNRLGFALQLCCLRYLGFIPDDLASISSEVVDYVAQQLAISPKALQTYSVWQRTRADHQRHIQDLLNYRRALFYEPLPLVVASIQIARLRVWKANPR